VTTCFAFLQPSKVPPISELGYDAYLELPSAKELIEAFKPKKGSVKALLLDQVLHNGNVFLDSVWLRLILLAHLMCC